MCMLIPLKSLTLGLGVALTALALWLWFEEARLQDDHHKANSCSKLELGQENPLWEPELQSALPEIREVLGYMMKERAEGRLDDPSHDGKYRRVQHPISWGCVDTTVEIDPTLSGNNKQRALEGIFAKKAKYSAVLRLSPNAFLGDNEPKGTGIALKFFGVSGQRTDFAEPDPEIAAANKDTVDFTTISSPFLPLLTTPKEIADVHRALSKGGPSDGLKYIALHRPTLALRALKVFAEGKGISNAFFHKHYSVVPVRVGNKLAAKIGLFPCDEAVANKFPSPTPSAEYIANYTQTVLNKQEACMHIMLQFQRDPCADQVDDFINPWYGDWEPIGYLRVAKGTKLMNDDKCDNLAFNFYRTLKANVPLGWVSRARREIYSFGANTRITKNRRSQA